jgi:Bacterial SH3 domain
MFAPTHKVPDEGLAAWATPDPAAAPVATLEGQLPVEIAETAGAWVRIVCSNGWTGWVDGRRLATAAGAPPVPAAPTPAPIPAPTPAPTPTPTPAPTGNETAVFEPLVNPGYAAPAATPGPVPAYQAAAPAAAWGVPAATPGPAASAGVPAPGAPSNGLLSGKSYITIGRIVAAVGVFFVIVSGWADWFSGPTSSYDAYLWPAHFLLDNRSGQGGLSLGLVILFLGLIGAGVTFVPKLSVGRIVVGAFVGFIVLLFMYQLYRLVDDFHSDFTDYVGIGPFVAGFGALLLIAGGIFDLAMRQHARHSSPQTPAPEPRPW